MFYSKKNETVARTGRSDAIGTILGQETLFEGLLTTSETVRIDGLLKGEIRSEGSVIIGETGRVDGNIHALDILVAGFVDGNIAADERMEVTSTGMIAGDIVTRVLVIEEGGSFKGNCAMETMMSKSAEPADLKDFKAEEIKVEEIGLAADKSEAADKNRDKKQEPAAKEKSSMAKHDTKDKKAAVKEKEHEMKDMDPVIN